MTILLIVSALFMLGSLLAFHVQFRRDTVEERLRLSSRILEIEAENRRLTESLCMSQGKAYIPVQAELEPARTWYDAPMEIQFVPKPEITFTGVIPQEDSTSWSDIVLGNIKPVKYNTTFDETPRRGET